MSQEENKDDDYHQMPEESNHDEGTNEATNIQSGSSGIQVDAPAAIEGLTKLFQKDKCEVTTNAKKKPKQTNEVQIGASGKDEVTYYRRSDEAIAYFRGTRPSQKYVVAVAGRSRIGKSCFLKHLFAIDKSIMQVGAGDKPVTQGMDLINEPYIWAPKTDGQTKTPIEFTILDCQGLNNQFDLEFDQDQAAFDAGALNRALEQQDVLLFAATAIFAGVILYYYDTNLSAAELSTITEASKLLMVWKNGAENFSLTKALTSGYRPKIIFLRRNTSDDDPTDYSPIPDKEENEAIRQVFDILNDKVKITLPAPTEADDLFRVEELALEDLKQSYIQRMEDVKEHCFEIFNNEEVPENLPNFLEIGKDLEDLFRDSQKENVQKLIEEQLAMMAKLRHSERVYKILQCLCKVFGTLLVLAAFLALINIFILLFTSLLNGNNCRTLQVQNNWGLLSENMLKTDPLCYQCLSEEMYLDTKQYDCLHECPIKYGPAKLNETRTAPTQKTCGKCSEHSVAHCLKCKDSDCITPESGWYIKTDKKANFTIKVAAPCERASPGCNNCSEDGKNCFSCFPSHKFTQGQCQLECAAPKVYDRQTDKCISCPLYWHRDPDDQTMCRPGQITKDRAYIDEAGLEQECKPYMVPREPQDIGTTKVPLSCQVKSCPDTQKILPNGNCDDCPKYHVQDQASQGKTCKLKHCAPLFKVTNDGKCLDCPSNQMQSDEDPGECKKFDCKPEQKITFKTLPNGKQALKCRPCPAFHESDPRSGYHNCTLKVCPDEHQKTMQFGTCQNCDDYQVQKPDKPYECYEKPCPSGRYMLEKNGQCKLCDDYQIAREDRKTCIQPECQGQRIFVNQDGECTECPTGYEAAADKKSCQKIVCPPPTVLFGNICDTCPAWKGFDSITKGCKPCQHGCKFCPTDRTKCEESSKLQRVVKNADGFMGRVTFTLEWRDHVDLDLHLKCVTEDSPTVEEVYFGHKTAPKCNASLDVDMLSGDTYYNHARDPQNASDIGQLENLYIQNLFENTYETYVKWYSGVPEFTHYTIYVVREFCGGEIEARLQGQDDKCLKALVDCRYRKIDKNTQKPLDFYYDPFATYGTATYG